MTDAPHPTTSHIHHAPIPTQTWQPQTLRGPRIIGLMINAHALARILAHAAIDAIMLENTLVHKAGRGGNSRDT